MLNYLQRNSKKILWLAILLYFVIFSSICIWKYFQFGYNGLDLAIFNQVFYNSAAGNLFYFTIHPQSYLGDHFEPIILLLLPFYYIFQHPLSLLILQSLVLSLSAWPIYLVAKRLLPAPWSLFLTLAWLFNPFVQNINLFEFHLLPFAIFFLLFAFYFYQQNKFIIFLIFCFLALLAREDVTLVIFMFSILALIDKRKLKWIIWPALLSISWFILAIKIITYFAPNHQYKFLYYYSWLGSNLKEIFSNVITHPWPVIKYISTWDNLLFTLGLMLPFTYLLKPKYLLLGILIYLQITFGGAQNSTIALKLHYTALLLPALFMAFTYSLKDVFQEREMIEGLAGAPSSHQQALHYLYRSNTKVLKIKKLKQFLIKEKPLTLAIIITAIIYSCLTLGPLPAVVKNLVRPSQTKEVLNLKKKFIQTIPSKNSLATTYEFLTPLSSRPKVYSLHYAFIGKQQFSNTDYTLPPDVEMLLIDFNDFLTYGLQFPNIKAWQEYYQNGDDNIRKLIKENDFKVSRIVDSLVIMEHYNDLGIKLYETNDNFNDLEYPQNINLDNQIKFLGWGSNNQLTKTSLDFARHREGLLVLRNESEGGKLISLYFKATKKLEQNFQLKLRLKNIDGLTIYQKLYPLAYGLYPTTEWPLDQVVKVNYWFLIPQELKQIDYQMEIQLVELKGFITLNGLRSVVPKITQEKNIGQAIPLD